MLIELLQHKKNIGQGYELVDPLITVQLGNRNKVINKNKSNVSELEIVALNKGKCENSAIMNISAKDATIHVGTY